MPVLVETATTSSPSIPPADKKSSISVTLDTKAVDQELVPSKECVTFSQEPCGVIYASGTAVGLRSLTVAIVRSDYAGPTDYEIIRSETQTLDSPSAQMSVAQVSGVSWSTTFKNTAGNYRFLIYSTEDRKLLLEKLIVVR